jgi:plastocyanin
MRRKLVFGAMLLLAIMVVAGCGGGGGQQGGQPVATAPGPGLIVTEKEWTIEFPRQTVKAGPMKLTIKNEGAIEHNFVIEGANVEVDAIQPGTSKEVTVNLKPGTYTVICNLAGHLEAGMKTTLTVAE